MDEDEVLGVMIDFHDNVVFIAEEIIGYMVEIFELDDELHEQVMDDDMGENEQFV